MAIFSVPHIRLSGLIAVVPPDVEENSSIPFMSAEEKKMFQQTTGIERRRIASAQITAADLCIRSAQRLLDQLEWNADEIDILVFVSQTPDHLIPGSSMFIQDQLGCGKNCLAIDLNQGCAGYVYGLSVISSMMSAGQFKKGLLLVGDTITKTIAKDDKSLVPIFSDAGSCTALEFEKDARPVHFNLQTDGSGYDRIIIEGGGSRFSDSTGRSCNLYMNGQDIFNFGLKEVNANIRNLLEAFQLSVEEIDYFVMHQANMLLNESIRKKTGIPIGKTLYSLKEFGNTSCATIPVTLSAHAGNLSNVRSMLLAGFGVGLSWGSCILSAEQCQFMEIENYA